MIYGRSIIFVWITVNHVGWARFAGWTEPDIRNASAAIVATGSALASHWLLMRLIRPTPPVKSP